MSRPVKRRQQVLVGEKIRELRKSRRLTQTDLAARIGIQQSDLCRMETGEYKVGLDTLMRILGIFGLDIGEFFQDSSRAEDGEEAEMIRLWKHLDRSGQEEVLDFVRFKSRQRSED